MDSVPCQLLYQPYISQAEHFKLSFTTALPGFEAIFTDCGVRQLWAYKGVALQARKAALECERLTKRIHDLREFNENERQVSALHNLQSVCCLASRLALAH